MILLEDPDGQGADDVAGDEDEIPDDAVDRARYLSAFRMIKSFDNLKNIILKYNTMVN